MKFIQDLHEVHIFGNLEILVMYLEKAWFGGGWINLRLKMVVGSWGPEAGGEL